MRLEAMRLESIRLGLETAEAIVPRFYSLIASKPHSLEASLGAVTDAH